jgi:hypothetical protein
MMGCIFFGLNSCSKYVILTLSHGYYLQFVFFFKLGDSVL